LFRHGEQHVEQVWAFIVQFSVFSNQFLVAQLRKVINADSLEGMRASKEILANEIGVVFNAGALHRPQQADVDDALDLEFGDVGQRRHGTAATLHFCDGLARLYGREDYRV